MVVSEILHIHFQISLMTQCIPAEIPAKYSDQLTEELIGLKFYTPNDTSAKRIYFLDSKIGYAIGVAGKIVKTTNAGITTGPLDLRHNKKSK